MAFLDAEIVHPEYMPMTAWLEHGPFAMWLVQKMRPRRIVELGTHYGYSYFAMCQIVKELDISTDCFAVDTWVGEEHAGFYDESVFESVVEENKKYAGFSHLLRKTFADALADVEDGSVDLLHVDGRHYYDDVKEDFESWIPKLSPSAVVLFHDTEVRERNFGVYRYWEEIANQRPSINFKHCHGLGVLFWGEVVAEGLRDLVEMAENKRDNALIVDYFAAEGGRLSALQELRARDTQLELMSQDKEARVAEWTAQRNALNERLAVSERQRLEGLALAQQSIQLKRDLAKARQKPWRSFRQKYKSKALYFLARQTAFFTERRREKFLRSARKRDPNRSLPEFADISNTSVAVCTGVVPEVLARRPRAQLKNDVKTVMVVSHDASRTGAPILALNLVRELSKRYNVVSVILGEGELLDDFAALSIDLLRLNRHSRFGDDLSRKIADFSKKNEVSHAFVNSVESRGVLPGLKRAGVPSVALLHEFASYIRPENAFADVFSSADQVVFSTRVTLESATAERGYEHPINVHLLPQGKCDVPKKAGSDEDKELERKWLDKILRPGGADDREFVVIGAGAIEPRKGIDLFIETATRVIAAPGGARFRFVWIGHGYDPVNDTTCSAYLADQIKRAGVHAQIQIVRATSEIEHAYAAADLMLMSSRLDPLPNVAIDMFFAGKPVMCFERTTGIVDFLDACGLREICAASYLDTTEMANKIISLADDPALLAEVANKGAVKAREVFDFSAYVARLDEIATTCGVQCDRIDEDLQYILSSGAFQSVKDRDIRKSNAGLKRSIRKYLESNRNGPHFRRPAHGFNQMVYAEEHGCGMLEDPFVQYLKAGRPAGRWSLQVIDQNGPVNPSAVTQARIALHVHVFYIEEFRDIMARLKLNKAKPTLFVSAPASNLDAVHAVLADYAGPVGDVQAVQNRGRDIAPFLTTFGPRLVTEFDIIGHLHTKRSLENGNREVIQRWVAFLMENCLGGSLGGAMLDRIVTAMSEAPDIGIVYPDDPQIIGWTKNRRQAEAIAARMGFGHLPEKIDFPAGTMFWVRADVLKRFVDMNLGWDDYPAEPLPIDGSILHAMERLFGVVPGLMGLKSGVTNVKGITR
jgi:glycosyltransferase involved in cell wall biosynthesis/predicted O-methyltransferase YrrM